MLRSIEMDVSQTGAKKVQELKQHYDKKQIKIGDSKTKINMSVFTQGDMKITGDVKAFLDRFDHNKDGKITEDEAVVLQKVLVDYAGSDKKLSEKEFAQMTGTEVGSPEFKKMWNSLNTIVTRQTTGSSTTTSTDKNGQKITSNLNADGSGTQIIESKAGKITKTFGKGGVLLNEVVTDAKGNTKTTNNTYNPEGKPISSETTVTNKSGKTTGQSRTQYNYENGLLTSKTVKTADAKKGTSETTVTYEYKDGVKTSSTTNTVETNKKGEKTTTVQHNQYQADGKTLAQSDKTVTKQDGTVSTTNSKYNESGKITEKHTVIKDDKGTVTKDLTTTNTYGENGKISKSVTTGTNANGEYNETINFDSKGNKTSVDMSYYKLGAKVVDHYEGANLDNRYGHIPSESIVYEDDGVTVKQKTINKFDADGVLIGQEIQDKDGNVISTHDFSKVDGTFDTSYQKGRGDCYLLAGLNALRASSTGMELLKQNITITQDAQGNNVYTITFPGAKEARQKLIEQGVPEDKIDIKESYTFTEAELHEKAKDAGKKYSAGDKDVLLLEVAYEQYRTEAKNDIQDLLAVKPDMKPREAETLLHARGVNSHDDGDNLSSGQGADAIFMLTGKPYKELQIRGGNDAKAVCQIGSDLNMTIIGSSSELSPEMSANIDNMLNKIEQDCKDGKLDDFVACVNFNVTSQVVNGQEIKGGGHAFSITKVEGDKVYLQNPWDPTKEIVMTRDELKQAATGLSINPLTKNGENNTEDIPDIVTPQTPPGGGSGSTPGTEPPTNPVEPQTHTVKRGDNMWKIAKKKLGPGASATQIANYVQKMIKANPQIKDPNKIYVGQKLNMPD